MTQAVRDRDGDQSFDLVDLTTVFEQYDPLYRLARWVAYVHYYWPKDVYLPDLPEDLSTAADQKWKTAWNNRKNIYLADITQGVRTDTGESLVSVSYAETLAAWTTDHPGYTNASKNKRGGRQRERPTEVPRLLQTVSLHVIRGYMLDLQHQDFRSFVNPDAMLFTECWPHNHTQREFVDHMEQISKDDPTRPPLSAETVAANDSIMVSAVVLQLYSDHIFDHVRFSVPALLKLVVKGPHDPDKIARMDRFADTWALEQFPPVEVGQYSHATLPVGLRAVPGDRVMPTAVIYRFLDAATEHFMRTEEATEKFAFLRASIRRNGHSLRTRCAETLKTTLTEGVDLLRQPDGSFLMCDMTIAGIRVTHESMLERIAATKALVEQLQTFVDDLEQRECEELQGEDDQDESVWAALLKSSYDEGLDSLQTLVVPLVK